MKKLSLLLFAISELYPCVVYASSDDEIRSIVKPCIDKIVSSVEGSGDGFTDDDLIKCASDLTRQNNKISISKAIAIVVFYAGEAYKPHDDTSTDSKGTYSGNRETPTQVDVSDVNMSVALNSKSTSVMSEKDDSKDAVVGSSPVTDTDPAAKAVVVSANRIMTDYELNEEKADDVYKDRRLCIKGKISKISVLGDEPFVEMSADSYGLRNVKFTLDKSRVNVFRLLASRRY